ncbi:MAG: stress response protein, partial [Acidobacteriota bacterium]
QLLPVANLFAYGQVKSAYGTGAFYPVLEEAFEERENVVLSKVESKEMILDSIKAFLGKGR